MNPRHVVVVAGAGTGKTHALVEHYLLCLLGLEHVDDGVVHGASHAHRSEGGAGDGPEQTALGFRAPDRVLAITFTDKAAAEMRARVQRRLADLIADPTTEPVVLARARAAGRSLDSAAERRALEELRRMVGTAPILTFHAFCGRTLREHALVLGLDPSFGLLDPEDERALLSETAEACVLDMLQRGSVAGAELVARVALRGWGERRGLVECLVGLHGMLAERGLDPASLRLATDDRVPVGEALAELARRVDGLATLARASTGQAAERTADIARASAAVAAAWRLDRGEVEDSEDSDREAAIARAFSELAARAAGNWGGKALADARRAVVEAVDAVGAALVDDCTAELVPVVRDLLVELDVRQQREKNARGFMAFGDLLVRTRDLLRDAPAVRAAVKGRFERVLVDEYQDTSPVQEDILALLLEEPSAGASHADVDSLAGSMWRRIKLAPGRGFVVGDPKQSVYGFRGADAGVFSRAVQVLGAGPDGVRKELAVSRRSLAPVVALANLVADRALPRGAHGVERAHVVPLAAARGGEGAAGALWVPARGPEGAASEGAASEGAASEGAAAEKMVAVDEAALAAAGIAQLLQADAVRPADVAVLVRRSSAAGPIALALARLGIASEVAGGDGFYARPEVADVIGALGLAIDLDDEVGVLAVLRSPFVAAPDDQILALYERLPRARGLTWPRVVAAVQDVRSDVQLDAGVQSRVLEFNAVLETVQLRLRQARAPGHPVARAIDALLDEGRYLVACAVEADADLRKDNIEKLRAMVDRASDSPFVTVARLCQALEANMPEPLASVSGGGGARDAVRIMTIHQSKGLEFPVVVLADGAAQLRVESDDLMLDPDTGLAVTERGRPIAACAPRARAGGVGRAATAVQRVRRCARERGEAELARVLYVALTRARDRVFVVSGRRRVGATSLLGILDDVRAAAPAAFDALLPTIEVKLEGYAAGAVSTRATEEDPGGEPTREDDRLGDLHRPVPASAPARIVRVSPSELTAAGIAPTVRSMDGLTGGIGLATRRGAGRLAHALVGLIATEHPEALDNEDTVIVTLLQSAAAALGAAHPNASLLEQCAATLAGPVRALVHEGYRFSFEESLRVLRRGVALEGCADLVARRPGRTVLVELKLHKASAALPNARLQACAYAAALVSAGEPDVHVALWALGDASPAAPERFSDADLRALDDVLLASRVSAGARRDPGEAGTPTSGPLATEDAEP